LSIPSEPNVYRDRNWLVAPVENAVFPYRCVKTNNLVEAPNYSFIADLLPQHFGPVSGSEGSALLSIARKRRLKYSIGLSSDLQAKANSRWRWGLAMVVFSPLVAIALGAGALIVTEKLFGKPSFVLGIAGGAVGFTLFVVGIVLFAMSTHAILRVIRSDGNYVWLDGAHVAFLMQLPESPEKWERPKLFG
jgi:hypothetical protein